MNPAQIPSLGATAGKNPDGTGNCDGAVNAANGAPVKVPCACPPDQATFTSVRLLSILKTLLLTDVTIGFERERRCWPRSQQPFDRSVFPLWIRQQLASPTYPGLPCYPSELARTWTRLPRSIYNPLCTYHMKSHLTHAVID